MSWETVGRRSSGNIADFANIYCEASVPTEPWEWPEVVVRDSKSHPELGTQANPIVIGDEPAPLGSASNPIVINVDEGWYHSEAGQPYSDADTEIMTTPEFWENLIDESYPDPENGGADVDPTSVPTRTRPPPCDDPDIQVLDKLVTECAQLDERVRILAESIGAAENCSSRGIATCGHSATGKREIKEDVTEGNILDTEPTMSHNVIEASFTNSDAILQEPTDPTDTFLSRKEPPLASSEARRTKHKFSCVKEVRAGFRRSECYIKRNRGVVRSSGCQVDCGTIHNIRGYPQSISATLRIWI